MDIDTSRTSLLQMLIQCSLPVFEGLLSSRKHNKIILDLLFVSATWHLYGKLRMHTDSTLRSLEATTVTLGVRDPSLAMTINPTQVSSSGCLVIESVTCLGEH